MQAARFFGHILEKKIANVAPQGKTYPDDKVARNRKMTMPDQRKLLRCIAQPLRQSLHGHFLGVHIFFKQPCLHRQTHLANCTLLYA